MYVWECVCVYVYVCGSMQIKGYNVFPFVVACKIFYCAFFIFRKQMKQKLINGNNLNFLVLDLTNGWVVLY